MTAAPSPPSLSSSTFPDLAVFFPEVLAVFFLDCDHL
jgi:hypothetical protein